MKINENLIVGTTGKTLKDTFEILETGSNSNGNYIKFTNGIMIQYGVATGDGANNDFWDSCNRTPYTEKYYPLNFKTVISCNVTAIDKGGILGAQLSPDGLDNTNRFKYFCLRSKNSGSTVYKVSYLAIGTWK